MWSGILMVYLLFAFINIFVVIAYVQKLKDINCDCSEDIKREIYWYYNIIMASILALYILLAFILFISFLIFNKKSKK